MDAATEFIAQFWSTIGEMAPYLLFGFMIAGILHVLISPRFVETQLGGPGFWPVFKASLFGVPLPLCSCGVIPVAASLRRHGASKGATASFLLSTPQTGVDSIFVTYSLLGPVFAVVRPIAALVSGLLGGSIVGLGEGNAPGSDGPSPKQKGDDSYPPLKRDFAEVMRYAFIVLPRDIAKPLLIGLVLASAISVWVPENFVEQTIGAGVGAMFFMMLLGIPLYVCATASVPIAAALLAKDAAPGAVLVFLMTGPATNAAAVAVVWKTMGRRTALIYFITVVVTALGFGMLLDHLPFGIRVLAGDAAQLMIPDVIKIACAVGLFAILAYAIFKPKRAEKLKMDEGIVIKIAGMNCSHCVNRVQKVLEECDGVKCASVDLDGGRAIIAGRDYKLDGLTDAVNQLGYRAEL